MSSLRGTVKIAMCSFPLQIHLLFIGIVDEYESSQCFHLIKLSLYAYYLSTIVIESN